ncbi:hypothetical protein BGX38DRAFT_1281189 [Terfezia claveryi]|nr:hypothetical protein BGX38DRAFT_1281189 [Terfezia claveryi]
MAVAITKDVTPRSARRRNYNRRLKYQDKRQKEILRDLEEDRRAGIPTRRKLPPLNQKLDRRDLEQVSKGHAAVRRITQLLTQQHQTIDEWVDRQAPDSKYKIYENRKIMRELHNIQRGLIQNTTARKKELEAIRSRVGHKNSKKFMTCLNQRWKAVNIGIAEFNELIEKLPIEQRPKELDIRKIKKEGLTLDTFWDVNCVRITDDWACQEVVCEGIAALSRQRRAQEEIIRIGIEIARVFDWIGKETYGATHSDTNGWLRPWIVQRLRHLQNIVTGFLKAQARYGLEISKTQRTMIMELQNRIHTMLTSIWSACIEVKECVEEEDFGDDDEVIGELLAREAARDFD